MAELVGKVAWYEDTYRLCYIRGPEGILIGLAQELAHVPRYTGAVNPGQHQALRHLLDVQRIASLGTLHDGSPYVSMVPFALLREEAAFVIHVSQLSPHTKDMIESPRVSLLIVASDTGEVPPQALARVTVQGRAERCSMSAPRYPGARESYLSRFPQAAEMFELPDFSLFSIHPIAVRFIGGFGQAMSLTPQVFTRALTA